MAAKKLYPTRIEDFNKAVATPAPDTVGSEGTDIDFSGKDGDILISVTTSPVTIKAGNGLEGVADLVVPAGKSVVLDSGCFKNVKGVHKGCVFVEGSGAGIWAVELP